MVNSNRNKVVNATDFCTHKLEIEALLKNGSTKKFIANRYNSTPANLHNWIKKNKIK
jgi:hypothetical protein